MLFMTLYRPFMKPAARHAMAIKSLDLVDWLEFGADRQHQMQVRRLLLDQRPDDVLAALSGSEDAQAELLALLLDHLELYAGDLYRFEADAVIERGTDVRFPRDTATVPPLALAGRLVQEDFCLLRRQGDCHHLIAAILCFPAHWSLAEKIGRPLLDIHEPVPGFAEQLGVPVERLLEKLDPERSVQRLNWSLVDTDDLYLPPSHRIAPVALAADDIGDRLWLRVERQTLRRLPITSAVVFGIRTYVTPIKQAIDTPEAADALIQRLDELPAPMQAYKNLVSVRAPLLAFLERRRAGVL